MSFGTELVEPEQSDPARGAPLRVGMIVHAYYLKDARVRRYAEFLAAQGHEVDVLCLHENDEPKTETHRGVNIHRIGMGRRRSGRLSYILEYLGSFSRFFIALNAKAWRRHYDVLHIHNMPNFLVFAALFQRLAGTKIVLDVHDLMSEVYQSKYQLDAGHWIARLLRWEERVSARFASAVIAANHAFADILAQRSVPSSKISVVMNAPSAMFFVSDQARQAARAGKPEGDYHIIYVGTVAPRYGLEDAVRAIARLNRQGSIPGLRFSIIPKISNEGDHFSRILAQIEEAGLKERFELMRPVPHDRMPAVFAQADALIYAPVPDVHMDIALSLKIPEAIAAGCPVVASRLSVNMRYFDEEALYCFDPGDVEECARRLGQVFDDPELRIRKVAAARARLQEISWPKQVAVYAALINTLVGRRALQRLNP